MTDSPGVRMTRGSVREAVFHLELRRRLNDHGGDPMEALRAAVRRHCETEVDNNGDSWAVDWMLDLVDDLRGSPPAEPVRDVLPEEDDPFDVLKGDRCGLVSDDEEFVALHPLIAREVFEELGLLGLFPEGVDRG